MATKFKLDALRQIHSLLKSNIDSGRKIKYRIPSLWVNLNSKKLLDYEVNPFLYYKNKIEEILEYNSPVKNGKDDLSGNWSRRAVTYNIFVRLTTAYDHNGNNQIDLPINEYGWRETGSFLKTIALFPNLKKMGINTLHFLPITSIGQDGNKGRLGSPYAIQNPYKLDKNLAEPILDLDVDFQFKALVEAVKEWAFVLYLNLSLELLQKIVIGFLSILNGSTGSGKMLK